MVNDDDDNDMIMDDVSLFDAEEEDVAATRKLSQFSLLEREDIEPGDEELEHKLEEAMAEDHVYIKVQEGVAIDKARRLRAQTSPGKGVARPAVMSQWANELFGWNNNEPRAMRAVPHEIEKSIVKEDPLQTTSLKESKASVLSKRPGRSASAAASNPRKAFAGRTSESETMIRIRSSSPRLLAPPLPAPPNKNLEMDSMIPQNEGPHPPGKLNRIHSHQAMATTPMSPETDQFGFIRPASIISSTNATEDEEEEVIILDANTLTVDSNYRRRHASSNVSDESRPDSDYLRRPRTASHSSSDIAFNLPEIPLMGMLLSKLNDLHDSADRANESKWAKWVNSPEDNELNGGASFLSKIQYTKEFRTMVLTGIPQKYRDKVWSQCSGALTLRQPGRFNDLVAQEASIDKVVLQQIEADIYRTCPTNVYFGGKGPGVAKLRRLLVAYACHNPKIGYCQGMNLLAATCLLVHLTEENSFWQFTAIMDDLLPENYFAPDLSGTRIDQIILKQYLDIICPNLASYLASLKIELEAITFNWFLTIFSDCLPPEVRKLAIDAYIWC